MFLTIFETPSFTFRVLTEQKTAGMRALNQAWAKHAEQTGADPLYLRRYRDDVIVVHMTPGIVTRDHEEMI